MRHWFPVILLSFSALCGCVSTRLYHDRAVTNNRSYYSGTPVSSVRATLGPSPGSQGKDSGEMVPDLIASALLLAQNPDYYSKSTIGGHCVRGETEVVTLQAPCTNVTFV